MNDNKIRVKKNLCPYLFYTYYFTTHLDKNKTLPEHARQGFSSSSSLITNYCFIHLDWYTLLSTVVARIM